jgi:hypothetical protein
MPMRGTEPVKLNGQLVYAYYTAAGGGLRVRVSVDEADRLDLLPGLPVGVQLPGAEAARFLVAAARTDPPFVWLDLVPLAARAG